MHRRLPLLILLASALALFTTSFAVASPDRGGGGDERVIVVLHDDVDAREAARDAERDHGAEVTYIYEHALRGFAASVPEGRVNGLRNDHRVDYVEPDRVVHAIGTLTGDLPTGVDRVDADENPELKLDGVDERVDARVAVIDTGVDFDHPDLNVNTALSVNCLYTSGGGPPWARDYHCVTGEGDDDNGHGTHVGGTIGALDDGANLSDGTHVVGVAPGVELLAVKVLDSGGSGYTSGIVEGIDYVTSLNTDSDGGNDVDVANMSLGGSGDPGAMEDAIETSVAAGVNYALAAGNSAKDVTDYTPAGQPDSLTVSALADYDGTAGGGAAATCYDWGDDDEFATFSNFGDTDGDRVDIIAPGVCILSTVPGGGYDGTKSGTSMAAPHVAGAAALLAASGTAASDIKSTLIGAADGVWDSTTDPDDSPDPLLNVDDDTVFDPALLNADGSGDSAPSVSVTSPSDGGEVSGTAVTLSADAADDDGVTQVEFSVDGAAVGLGTDDGTGTWSLDWDSTSVSDGDHTVTATATDTADQTASDSISVTVDNVDDPPSVTIVNPADGATVSGTVAVSADATDDNGVSGVEFLVDGTSIGAGTDDGTGTWSIDWDTTGYTDGTSHTVEAVATDTADQTASHQVSVTVDNSVATADVTHRWDTWGGKNSDKHLASIPKVIDDDTGDPIADATVSITLDNTSTGDSWTGTATTGSSGEVRFELKNAPRGDYVVTIDEVSHASYTWDSANQPANNTITL